MLYISESKLSLNLFYNVTSNVTSVELWLNIKLLNELIFKHNAIVYLPQNSMPISNTETLYTNKHAMRSIIHSHQTIEEFAPLLSLVLLSGSSRTRCTYMHFVSALLVNRIIHANTTFDCAFNYWCLSVVFNFYVQFLSSSTISLAHVDFWLNFCVDMLNGQFICWQTVVQIRNLSCSQKCYEVISNHSNSCVLYEDWTMEILAPKCTGFPLCCNDVPCAYSCRRMVLHLYILFTGVSPISQLPKFENKT